MTMCPVCGEPKCRCDMVSKLRALCEAGELNLMRPEEIPPNCEFCLRPWVDCDCPTCYNCGSQHLAGQIHICEPWEDE